MKASRVLTLISAAMGIFILALAGISIWLEREEALEAAHNRLSALNQVLSEQLERSMQSIDLVLDDISENMARNQDWADRRVYSLLRAHAVAIPQIRALVVVDKNGNIVNDSVGFPATPIYVGDRDYFTHQQNATTAGMYINVPHKSRRDKEWTVVLSRRIPGKDGSFAGVVFARLQPRYFQELYRDTLQQEGSATSIYRRDGILLLRQPHVEELTGKNVSHIPLFAELRKAERGSYRALGGIDGKPRLLSYTTLHKYPLVLNVSQEQSAILSSWRSNANRIMALTFIALLLGFALARRLAASLALQEQSAEAISGSEKRLHFITDNIVDAIWAWEPDKGLTYVSPALAGLLRLPAEQLLGRPLEMLYDHSKIEAIQNKVEEFRRCTADGCGTHHLDLIFENEIRPESGPPVWTEDSLRLFLDAECNLSQIQGLAHNVTPRKQMEESLQKVVVQLNKAQEMAHIGSWELDLQSGQLAWSDEIFRIFELDPGQFAATYQAFLDTIHPDDRDKVDAAYTRSLADKTPYRIEHRLLMADGRVKHVQEHGETVYDAAGKALRSIGTVQDITGQKSVEEALLLNASVFENSLEGIVITDPQERILSTNKAFSDITGYSLEEVRGKTPRLLQSGLQDKAFYRELWNQLKENGSWRGEIWNRRKNGEFYAGMLNITAVRNAHREVSHYVAVFGDITDIKNIQRKLESIANFDPLTGLPNRILLADRLRQAIAHTNRYGRELAICFLDLDDFKPINDQYGHEAGDRLLIEIAARLTHTLRSGDTVARIGGDEFVILINDIQSKQELEELLSRILAAISPPCWLDGREMCVSGSIGATLYPSNNAEPDTLLRHADQAMYQAKKLGRNRFHFFDLDQDSEEQTRLLQLQRIQQAVAQGEMRLFYQPKLDMRNGQIVGAEALIRWQHPDLGLRPPLEFLPIAEQSDLIVTIGEWVLHEALRHCATWQEQGLRLPVSVNIAARHFQRPDFARRLHEILSGHPHVSPAPLELEITESTALNDIEEARNLIVACQEIGVRFALDDFGTGYSSLTYLKRLPVDTLKIDQSFVLNMLDDQEDLAIVEGVVGLASAFERSLVAEGVETAEHGMVLMQLGCDIAQGYGIARPMPAEAVMEWVRQYHPDNRWALWSDKHWERSNLPLLLAEHDHITWVARVVDSLNAPASQPAQGELEDHHQCRFGRWYDTEGKARYAHLREFCEIDAPHAEVHRVGREIVRLRDAGDLEAAKQLVEQLHELKEQILAKLATLQQAVANGHSPQS